MNLFRSTTITLQLKNSINCSPLRRAFLLVPLALALFAVVPAIRAVVPPPDGGHAGNNTAEGTGALSVLTTGLNNTALGFHALNSNGTGNDNTATGSLALHVNTTGDGNTATGSLALGSNGTGDSNTATGSLALGSNQDGRLNTANGFEALRTNQHGSENTATGDTALFANTADGNTADGSGALHDNTTGKGNTATGDTALFFNTIGHANTADGFQALVQNTTGNSNIALGNGAGFNLTTGSCNIDIGNNGQAGESNIIRIGTQISREGGCGQTATFIAGIRGVTTGNADAVAVVIDSAGQLGTMSSSLRFKKEIKPMDVASESILALKPVTFHYKGDKTNTPQFGLIAEDVATVNRDLVVRDKDGEIYTVRYEAVNAMLLNEFLKEHRKVEELEKQIKALTATVQKVSEQVEVNKPVSHLIAND